MRHALIIAASILPLSTLYASVQVTDEMRAMAAALGRVIRRCGWTIDQAARFMGIGQALLSRQIALRDGAHPSWARMGLLPDPAKVYLAQELCDMSGDARVVTDQRIDAVIVRMETLVERRRQQRTLPVEQERRRA